jgi:subtilase family serine protease
MKKLLVLSAGISLLAATLPLMAQAPANGRVMTPPVRVAPVPQTPNSPGGLLPREVRAAYGFNQLTNFGAGVTIALVDAYDDPNIASDLAFYASYFHFGPCNFTKVKLATVQGQGWDLEESLDVQQACALAPQANIILVEAVSNNNSDLYNAVQVATQPPYNADVVSMSWGGGEYSTETDDDQTYFCNITNGNGHPVTFFASSGDGGHGVGYPAASHCVVAVGGTELTLTTATPLPNPLELDYGHEIAWSGSSGGVSQYEPQQSWQNPACATWSTTNRCVPDISSVAFLVPVYDTYSYSGWVTVEGTSISSPDWASFIALVNSERLAKGEATLSQAASDLYTLFYNSGDYATDFHDITTGENGSCGSQCNAGPGYDLVTGIGTFQANNLYAPLVADTN